MQDIAQVKGSKGVHPQKHRQRVAATIAGVMALFPLTSWAQYQVTVVDNGPEYRQFGRVEITGSSVINPRSREALPVRVIDRKEIERMGVQSVPELIQGLSSMHSFTEAGGTNISGQGGYRSAAIHGYEAGTLVLINGRRAPSFAKQRPQVDRTAVDLSMVPLRAIERVEILTDGASSIYGSDAIAGVVNLITLKQAPGLSLSAEKLSTPGAGDGQSAGISWGQGKLDLDGYAVSMHLEKSHTDPVRMRDRAYTDLRTQVYGQDAQSQPLYFVPQNMFAHNAPAQLLSNSTNPAMCPADFDYSVTRRTTAGWPTPYQCQTSQLRDTYLYPAYDNTTLWVAFEKQIDATLAVFAERGYQQQLSDYRRIVNGRATNGNMLYDAEDFNPGFAQEKQNNHRTVIGVRGQWRDWHYTGSHTRAENRFETTNRGGFINATNWGTILTDAERQQDPATYAEATWAKIQARYAEPTNAQRYRTQLQDTQLQASRTVGENPWGDIKLGTVLFRTQSQLTNSLATNREDYPFTRTNTGAALELQLPLYNRLEWVSSLRAERYSDFGHVLTGKLGAKWEVADRTHVRTSAGTGFRAPTLAQTSPRNGSIFSTTSLTDHYSVGNPDLEPERSRQWSWGILSQPTPQWSLSMDYWALNVRDVFGIWTAEQIANDPELKALYFTPNYNGTGKNRYLFKPFNQGTMAKSGIDYHMRYRWPVSLGRVWLGLEGTYNLKANRSTYPGQTPVSNLANYDTATGTVTARHLLRLTSSLESPQFVVSAQVHYHSGNHEVMQALIDSQGYAVGDAYIHRVPAHWTLEVSGVYRFTPAISMRVHMGNLTNRTPPVRYQTPYLGSSLADTRYDDYLGRTLRIAMDIKF
jgi:iron complex outermembrane receptor protein